MQSVESDFDRLTDQRRYRVEHIQPSICDQMFAQRIPNGFRFREMSSLALGKFRRPRMPPRHPKIFAFILRWHVIERWWLLRVEEKFTLLFIHKSFSFQRWINRVHSVEDVLFVTISASTYTEQR
jgi:hypothetical protein